MMEIHFKIIPQSEQPYDTTGDWRFDGRGDLQVRCSMLGNEKYEFLILLPETIE